MNLIDLHCDTVLRLMEDGNLKENSYGVDIAKLRSGSSLAQFFALFVDLAETRDPLLTCLEHVGPVLTSRLNKTRMRLP